MIFTFSPREVRTIRAALRCWLNEIGFHSTAELQSHYPELGTDPMSADEVEMFLAKLVGGLR